MFVFFVTDDHCSILHRLLPSNMVLALSCNIKGCLLNFFVSQYFLISVSSVAKSGFFFFWPSGWCLPTKNRKITACNASLSGNQSAQPPPRGYSSEGDSGGTLSEGQRMRFCCLGKLFPEPYNMCHISCLNSCHWAEERQQKRFEGMDIEELGSKDTQVGRKFQEAWQLWHWNTVVRVMSQNPEDCTVLPKENPLPSTCFVSPLLHKPWNSSDNLEMENRYEQTKVTSKPHLCYIDEILL